MSGFFLPRAYVQTDFSPDFSSFYMKAKRNIIAWNVRDLNGTTKHQPVFTYLNSLAPAVVCLQETHITKETTQVSKAYSFSTQYHSCYTSHSRGVSITKQFRSPPGVLRWIRGGDFFYGIPLIVFGVYL